MEQQGSNQLVKAAVPLSEMFGYATDLRSISQGRANFYMDFQEYAKVPSSVEDKLMKSKSNNEESN
jgi:elongation factor G